MSKLILKPHIVPHDEIFKAIDKNSDKIIKEIINKHLENMELFFETYPNMNKDDDDLFDNEDYLSYDLLNIMNEEYNTPLHYSIISDNIDDNIIEDLIKIAKVRCDIVNKDGLTPLLLAVKKNKPKIVTILSKYGNQCTVNDKCQQSPYTGYSPLHYCSTWTLMEINREEEPNALENMARLLITLGANVNIKNTEGETPLHVCCRNGVLSVAKLLISEGADVNIQNKHKVTPIMIAATLGNLSMVELLLDIELQDEGNINLNNNNIKINLQDQFGDTVLHFAFQSQLQRVFPNGIEVSEEHERIAYRLVHEGNVDLNIKSKDGYLATDFTSDAFKFILKIVSENRELFPPNLELLLELPEHLSAPLHLDPLLRNKFIESVKEYRKERTLSNELESKKSGCPMVTANKNLMKKRGQLGNKSNNSNNKEIVMKEEKKEEMKMPMNHPHFSGGDASKCPFLHSQGGKSNNTETTSSTTNTSALENNSSSTVAISGEKGKCPIPFHNELAMIFNKQNLIFLVILIVAVIIARSV
ncbi:hypothetical protein ABK040_009888 [Willaertia magna]